MAEKFSLRVNGAAHTIEADPDMPLLYALRDDLGMSNPHFGCGLSQCGACTVHVDGVATRSCVTPVSRAAGAQLSEFFGSGAVQRGSCAMASGPSCHVARSVECAVGTLAGQSPVPKTTKFVTFPPDVTGRTKGSPMSPS